MEEEAFIELENQLVECLESIREDLSIAETEETRSMAPELYSLGYHCYESGKYAEATHFFTTLTKIDGKNPKGWIGLAASLQMQKLYDEALLAYSTAAVLDPNDPEIFFHAANCCFSLEYVSEALKALDAAENIAKKMPESGAMIQQFTTLREAWSNV